MGKIVEEKFSNTTKKKKGYLYGKFKQKKIQAENENLIKFSRNYFLFKLIF